MNPNSNESLATASLVCGIAGIVIGCCCCGWLGILLGAAAIATSVMYKNQNPGIDNQNAKIGMILGIIACVIAGASIILGLVMGASMGAMSTLQNL